MVTWWHLKVCLCVYILTMANTLSEALLVLTSWNTASDDLTSQPTRTLVKHICKKKLQSEEVAKLYCTVIDVEVSDNQKKDAASVGVTLIPATRAKWSDPEGDPPAPNWLLHHDRYYPMLNKLQHIKHVVSFSRKTKNAAAAIHESLFPQAQLHQISVPTPPGVVFAFDAWNKHACGLTGYHRATIKNFLTRKAEAGEYLKAYSTVVDVELSRDQIEDARRCGVSLIKAHRKKGVDEVPNTNWLMNHYSHFPELKQLTNIKYVVGYAPKTGWAAVDIRKELFPSAKLVLINHACQEQNCLLVKGEFSDLEQEMVQMASQADILFSIGPNTYNNFQRAYRAVIDGRKLSDIPHKEILPKPGDIYFGNAQPDAEVIASGHYILTYGQLNTEKALRRCDLMAASIGSAAKRCKDLHKQPPKWKMHGVSEQAYKETKNFLDKNLPSSPDMLTLYKQYSAETLLQSLQQSDLCLPPSCYTDYSFEGLEAMAAGLPTTVQDDSHIAAMIEKHFEDHKDYCVVRNETEKLTSKLITNLTNINVAVQQAKLLRDDFAESKAVAESLANFAALFAEEDEETLNENKNALVKDEEDRAQTTMTKASEVQHERSVNEGMETMETTAVQPWISVTGLETTETTAVQPGMPVSEGMETIETKTVSPGISVMEGKDTSETTKVHSVLSIMEDIETMETNVVRPQISTMEDIENTEITLPSSIPRTGGLWTTQTTSVHTSLQITEGMGTLETRAVHSEMPVLENIQTRDTKAMEHKQMKARETDNSDNITNFKITGNEHSHSSLAKPGLASNKRKRKRKGKGHSVKDTDLKQLKKKQLVGEEKMSPCVERPRNDNSAMFIPMVQSTERVSTNPGTPTTPSIAPENSNDSGNVKVHVKLNEESYKQQMRDLDKQFQTRRVSMRKKNVKAAWERCQAELHNNTDSMLANETKRQIIGNICEENLGKVKVKSTTKKSLEISLDLPTLYNLYRLEHTCLSGSFSGSFEPLLITDKMREEADKVGLQLTLQATYDQARFNTLKLFFINRDGGGLESVKVFHDIIEQKDAEEIHIDGESISAQKPCTMVTRRVHGNFQTEQGEDGKHSKFEVERKTVESQLKEAKEEKASLEERCKELTQKLESTEQSFVSHRVGNNREKENLHCELEKKDKLIKELRDKVAELDQSKEQSVMHKGDWSLTLVNGQHQGQGQKFNRPRGLAFHRDKLVVCDNGNNIVQVLNKDYTCDKVIGRFDGQFAKSFRPRSVAISRFNHYYILDDENKQIVVCEENGKITKIITLPENTEVVWDIALMDEFVLVTLTFTDTRVRSEGRDDRLVKYTQDGQYVADAGGKDSGKIQFNGPVSVVVNSNNVIMVYDTYNYCIKCFDSNLNFLYQYGEGQLSRGILGHMAVDEDDNVYVCNVTDRIIKFRCDGKWICNLFQGDVRGPRYIAGMVDKIGVEEYDSDQIKVFSK